MKRRKICVVTGSRAEFGLLSGLLQSIRRDRALSLALVATGSHFSKRLGETYREIEREGFRIDRRIPLLRYADDSVGIVKTIGWGCMKFADAFAGLKPDLVVLLGDRYEILAAAIAAYTMRIPLAHIHGGEVTGGALDEAYRHAITKMAALHFTSTEIYHRRVIQLGERPERVFTVGAPGIDAVYHASLFGREELGRRLGFDLSGKVALVTYHPETLKRGSPSFQAGQILKALEGFDGKIIFTSANADAGGAEINRAWITFCCRNRGRALYVANLGQQQYLSLLQHCLVIIGNSSSGIIEASSFGLPVINIGDRQAGRVRAGNVIDVPGSCREIRQALRIALTPEFRQRLKAMVNPYDPYRDGRAAGRIKKVLKSVKIDGKFLKKSFVDISFQRKGAR